jgi:hypothetical protein
VSREKAEPEGDGDGLVKRFNRWLHAPSEAEPGEVVELTRLPSEFEAEALAAGLRDEGFKVAVLGSDAGGMAPHYGVGQGTRVMVLAEDLPRARALLGS